MEAARAGTEVDQRVWVPQSLDQINNKIVRMTRAYFMESLGPDRNRIESEIHMLLVEEHEIRRRVYT